MMKENSLSLKYKNSFGVETIAKQIFYPDSVEDLQSLPDLTDQNFYVLGEGSNTLFTDDVAPIIICPHFKGIEINENDSHYIIKVGASENWHDLVTLLISEGIFGLENLALIPGSCGAAPIQNIGAYGVEFSDYCLSLEWFDFKSKTSQLMNNNVCNFGYRDSIFKRELNNRGLIVSITLKLEKRWQANLSYQGLGVLSKDTSAENVFSHIIKLRQSKLPDPKVLPNAGSFFKNPMVDVDTLAVLKGRYPNIPFYPQTNDTVKLAAGWLIEECGLKGYRNARVGVHDKQSLVLINHNSGNGFDIVKLAKYVQDCVDKKFSVMLQPEVKMVTSKGEVNFTELN